MTPDAPDELLVRLVAMLAREVAKALRDGNAEEAPRLRTIAEAAVQLGIKERSMRALVNGEKGEPPRMKSVLIGRGARRVEQAEIDRYLAERRRDG